MFVNIKRARKKIKQNEPHRNGREKDAPSLIGVVFSEVFLPPIKFPSFSSDSAKKPLPYLHLSPMITHGKLKYSEKSVIFVINYLL